MSFSLSTDLSDNATCTTESCVQALVYFLGWILVRCADRDLEHARAAEAHRDRREDRRPKGGRTAAIARDHQALIEWNGA